MFVFSNANSFSKRLGAVHIACAYAIFSVLWIAISGAFLQIAVDDPVLKGRLELGKGLIFVAVTSVLLYLLLKAWSAPWKDLSSLQSDTSSQSGMRRLVLAFLVLTFFVPFIGYLVVKLHAPQTEKDAFANLQSIVDLKGQQIENWVAERRNAGTTLIDNVGFIKRVADIQRYNDATEMRNVRNRLETLMQAHGFGSVLLADAKGKVILALGEHAQPLEVPIAAIDTAFRSGQVQRSKLLADGSCDLHFSYIVPLIQQQGSTRLPIGAVILHVEPERFIFPYVQHWPVASPSGETLLVHQEGDSVAYLSAPRHTEMGDGVLKHPLGKDKDPATAAIMAKQPGVMHGLDYRGEPVLVAYRPIADSEWYLLAKLDQAEVLQPLRDLGRWISVIAFCAVLAISAALLLLWRQQRYAQQLAAEHRADRLLRLFYDLPFIGMGIASPDMSRWLQCNQRLGEILGYSAEELAAKSYADLSHPDDKVAGIAHLERLKDNTADSYDLNQRFIHKDGAVVFVTMHVRCMRKEDGAIDFLIVNMQDITERKADEARIQRLTQLYAALSHCNQAIVRCTREADMFDSICRTAVEYGGMRMAWIGRVNEDETISPVSFFGEGLDYLDNLCITAKADDPHGQGPAGYAIRTNRPAWNQDFMHDPRTAPWHTGAVRFGWQSVAALPLRRQGAVIGVFMLYSAEPGAFDQTARNLLVEMASDISFALDYLAREEARKEAESQLRLAARVFEQSSEGFMITDSDNRIVMVNKAFSDITGYSAAEALGSSPSILSSGHQREDFYRAMWSAIEKDGYWQGEVLNRRKNGSLYLEWLSISRVVDEDKNLTQHIGIFSDITNHRAAEEQVNWLTHFDTLTGLPNRTLLDDRCKHAISLAQQSGDNLALMFLDLDHFKNINESLGYGIGDALLSHLGQSIADALHEQDTISRIGGDDFVLILPGTDADGAAHVAERLLAEVDKIHRVGQHELSITASIGIAIYPENGQDLDSLSRSAEAAMYRAKQDGRNTFRFFAREMQEQATRNLQLESALRRALERNQFSLHYQPQVSLTSGQIVGVEALLRWEHAEFGPVSPAEFIPIAESCGLILPIGEWVLNTAVRQMKAWLDQGLKLSTIAVNISAVQFRHPRLPDQIMQVLEAAELPSRFLELEMTESVAMEDPVAAVAVVKELRERGVRVSIDDFGTGHSSLGHLKRFNAYKLKIDRSFVRDIASDPEDRAIVDAIINMADSLGIQTIAEGVETEEQLNFLRKHGCQEVQGFYFSRPVPARQIEQLLQEKTFAA